MLIVSIDLRMQKVIKSDRLFNPTLNNSYNYHNLVYS